MDSWARVILPLECGGELGRANVYRAGAFVSGLGLVRDLGALIERAKAVAGDRALVDEQVLRAVIGGDEAEALLVAEPLHGSTGHVLTPLVLCAADAEDARSNDGERLHCFRAKCPTNH